MATSWRLGLGIAALLASTLPGCGGGGGDGDGSNPPSMANQPPAFTSAGTTTVPENTAGVFYTATATDPDGNR